MKLSTLASTLMMLAGSIANGQPLSRWTPPPNDPVVKPKQGCPDLRSLTGYEFTLATATLQPATPEAPEHCRVSGQVQPEVRFEVNLPTAWNRRFYQFGNGGYAGESFESAPRIGQRNLALRHGFAVASHNTGHDAATEPLGTFAVNRQKLFDYAFRSLHVTATTAKKLIQSYYGMAPARSYHIGCSTGGRQSLILAQRFPEDFDGILVGAPVLDFTGTMTSYARMIKALAVAPIPSAKLKTLAASVYRQCDSKDGLADGLIDDPRRCGFRPSEHVPVCKGDIDNAECFTPKQIETLEAIYGDVVSQGKRIFPGWPVGAEIEASPTGRSGWLPWLVRDDGPTISFNFAETFFRHMAFSDPKYEVRNFDLERDPQRLEWIHQVLDATDPDLSRFRDRSGRMIMYYGWADPALNARMGVEYYEKVLERMGGTTTEFFRLFMVPGMFHCSGGVGCGNFDPLTPLVRWVEQGSAPATIEAAQMREGKTVRTRPLCVYPEVAKYKGSGSIDDAANFACGKT